MKFFGAIGSFMMSCPQEVQKIYDSDPSFAPKKVKNLFEDTIGLLQARFLSIQEAEVLHHLSQFYMHEQEELLITFEDYRHLQAAIQKDYILYQLNISALDLIASTSYHTHVKNVSLLNIIDSIEQDPLLSPQEPIDQWIASYFPGTIIEFTETTKLTELNHMYEPLFEILHHCYAIHADILKRLHNKNKEQYEKYNHDVTPVMQNALSYSHTFLKENRSALVHSHPDNPSRIKLKSSITFNSLCIASYLLGFFDESLLSPEIHSFLTEEERRAIKEVHEKLEQFIPSTLPFLLRHWDEPYFTSLCQDDAYKQLALNTLKTMRE